MYSDLPYDKRHLTLNAEDRNARALADLAADGPLMDPTWSESCFSGTTGRAETYKTVFESFRVTTRTKATRKHQVRDQVAVPVQEGRHERYRGVTDVLTERVPACSKTIWENAYGASLPTAKMSACRLLSGYFLSLSLWSWDGVSTANTRAQISLRTRRAGRFTRLRTPVLGQDGRRMFRASSELLKNIF